MKTKLIAAALAATLSAPIVQAANPDNLTQDGSGDVILVMRNAANTETLFWDLSTGPNDLTSNDFRNDLALAFSINDAAVNGWVGANIGAGPLTFNIFGLSEVLAPPPANPFLPPDPNPAVGGVMTVPSLAITQDGAQTQNSVNELQQFMAGVNSEGFVDNGVLVTNNPAGNAFFGNNFHGTNLFGMGASGAVNGGLLPFFFLQQDPLAGPGAQGGLPQVASLLGAFDFSFDTGVATLTYTGAQVPVPPAVWLFGSAIAGLAGVRRRKTA